MTDERRGEEEGGVFVAVCVWIRSGVEEEARSCGRRRESVCGACVCVCEEWKAEEDSDDERCVCVCV